MLCSQVEAQELVVDVMKEVFRLHGATPMASTGVGVAPAVWAPDAVSLLAPDGAPWGLRYDLRHPFVAWLARQAALLTTSAPFLLLLRPPFQICSCWRGISSLCFPFVYTPSSLADGNSRCHRVTKAKEVKHM